MIKRLDNDNANTTVARPRRGVNHVSVIVERLMKMYELRAEMSKQQDEDEMRQVEEKELACSDVEVVDLAIPVEPALQATFGWFNEAS